ncbi:MAG: helix-turn-helix domain-containing protein [Planctomycetota bacterium]|jgi:AraC-like DNA-binding protein
MNEFKKSIKRQLDLLNNKKCRIRYARIQDIMNPLEAMHCHTFPELAVLDSGLSVHRFPNETIRLYAGDILVIPRGVPHKEFAYNHKGEFKNLIIAYDPGTIKMHYSVSAEAIGEFKLDKMIKSPCDDSHAMFEYIESASQLHFSKQPGSNIAAESLVTAFFARLLSLLSEKNQIEQTESTKVLIAYEYIERNIASPDMNVQSVAKELTCSADYLSHIFSQETGKRLTEYINQKRVALASEYLTKTNLTIGQISKQCGYSQASYFNKQFKKIMKCMPKEFRKQTAPHGQTA